MAPAPSYSLVDGRVVAHLRIQPAGLNAMAATGVGQPQPDRRGTRRVARGAIGPSAGRTGGVAGLYHPPSIDIRYICPGDSAYVAEIGRAHV